MSAALSARSPPLQEYLFPIREGVLARLSIPRDTTAHELARFAEFVHTLAVDFVPAPDVREAPTRHASTEASKA